jgi:hypothetical protein
LSEFNAIGIKRLNDLSLTVSDAVDVYCALDLELPWHLLTTEESEEVTLWYHEYRSMYWSLDTIAVPHVVFNLLGIKWGVKV